MAGTLGFSTPQMHANPSYEALVLKCDQIKGMPPFLLSVRASWLTKCVRGERESPPEPSLHLQAAESNDWFVFSRLVRDANIDAALVDIITQEYNTVRRERQFLEVAAEQDTHESTSLRKVVLDHIEVLEQTEETYEELLGIEDEDARRQLYAIKMD